MDRISVPYLDGDNLVMPHSKILSSKRKISNCECEEWKGDTNAGGCRSSLYIMALDNAVATVEFLLNHGANTELQDCDGRTALHVAAWQGYTDIVQVKIFVMV